MTTNFDESTDMSDRNRVVPVGRRLLDGVLLLGATGTAVIFLSGLVFSLVSLCFVRHPFDGWSDLVVEDAKAVATGHFQYGNPANHFVGLFYTPLFTWLFHGSY